MVHVHTRHIEIDYHSIGNVFVSERSNLLHHFFLQYNLLFCGINFPVLYDKMSMADFFQFGGVCPTLLIYLFSTVPISYIYIHTYIHVRMRTRTYIYIYCVIY